MNGGARQMLIEKFSRLEPGSFVRVDGALLVEAFGQGSFDAELASLGCIHVDGAYNACGLHTVIKPATPLFKD